MNSCLSRGVSLMVVTMAMSGILASEKTCADIEFTGFGQGETFRVVESNFVNVTFHLATSKCTYSPEWFRVKVSSNQSDYNVGVCTIIVQNEACNITDQSSDCRCVASAGRFALLYKEFNQSIRALYMWSWSDSMRNEEQKKTHIMFDIRVGTKSEADVTTASSVRSRTESSVQSLHVTLVVSIVTASAVAIAILIVTVIIVCVYRRRKAGITSLQLEFEKRRNLKRCCDVTSDVKAGGHQFETTEAEYSEIGYLSDQLDPVPSKVNEIYERPMEQGEGQSQYSELHYYSRCQKAKVKRNDNNRCAKDSRYRETRKLSPSEAAVSTGETGRMAAPGILDDYLHPVQTTTEALN